MNEKTSYRKSTLLPMQWLVLIMTPILMWGFFWYVGFDHVIEKMAALGAAVLLLLFFFFKLPKDRSDRKSNGYLLKIFLFLTFISILNAWFYWNQSPAMTFSAGYAVYMYIYFFVLKQFKVDQRTTIKLILVLAIIYSVLWVYAFQRAPEVTFGNSEEINDNRGMFRVDFMGSDMIYLSYFFALTRFLEGKRKWLYLLVLLISSFLIFSTLSRMIFAATALVSLFYIFRKHSLKIKIIAIIIISMFFTTVMNNDIINSLIELQERQEQMEGGDASIIRSEYYDAFERFPFHVSTFLLGHGDAHPLTQYGKWEESLKDSYAFNRSDAGYPAVYVTYGVIGLAVLLLIMFRALRRKVPDEYYFYKLYIIFFAIICLTTNHFIMSSLSFIISIYSLDQASLRTKVQLS